MVEQNITISTMPEVPASNVTPHAATSFTLLSQFPTEIRELVWERVVPRHRSIMIALYTQLEKNNPSATSLRFKPAGSSYPPEMLSCRLARASFMKHTNAALSIPSSEQKIPFNSNLDNIHVYHVNLILELRKLRAVVQLFLKNWCESIRNLVVGGSLFTLDGLVQHNQRKILAARFLLHSCINPKSLGVISPVGGCEQVKGTNESLLLLGHLREGTMMSASPVFDADEKSLIAIYGQIYHVNREYWKKRISEQVSSYAGGIFEQIGVPSQGKELQV